MNDVDKLRVLLPHWMEHNAEHAKGFRTWAGRARAAGEEDLADHIIAAAKKMEAANRNLESAIEHLGEGGGVPAPARDQTPARHGHPH